MNTLCWTHTHTHTLITFYDSQCMTVPLSIGKTVVVCTEYAYYAMLKGIIKKSLFITNQYSLPGHTVMGLTAWGGETRDNIIQFIPFTASLSLTMYWVISISLRITFYVGGGHRWTSWRGVSTSVQVYTLVTCVLHFFLSENVLYLYIHSYSIHMCCTRHQLTLQLLNLSSCTYLLRIWCQWTVWVTFVILKVRPCWKERKPFKSMYFLWLFFIPNAVWYIMFFLSYHLMLHAELGPYHSFTVVVSKYNTFNKNNSIK